MFKDVDELGAVQSVVPTDGFTVDNDGAAFLVAPVYVLTVNVESWGGWDIDAFADAHVEADFFGDLGGADVLLELFEIAFAIGDFFEIFTEECGAFGAGSIFPFGLIRKELIGVFFPVALKAGGFSSGSGSGGILMIAE